MMSLMFFANSVQRALLFSSPASRAPGFSSFFLAVTLEGLSALTSDLRHTSASFKAPPALHVLRICVGALMLNPRAVENPGPPLPDPVLPLFSEALQMCAVSGWGGPASENIILRRMPQGLCQEYQPHVTGAQGAGKATVMPPGTRLNPPLTAFKKKLSGRTKGSRAGRPAQSWLGW